jgi:hypothetical protein
VTQEISSGDLQWYDMTNYKSISTLSETSVELNRDYCPKTQEKKLMEGVPYSQIVKCLMYMHLFVLGWNVYSWLKFNLVPCEP